MKRSLFILSFFFITFSKALPPAGSELYKNYFTWNPDRRLEWNDFQGKPDGYSEEVAMTASSVEFSYKTLGSSFSWEVIAKYFPKLSWSRKSDQSDYILRHEQLHFDITELYARLFRKQLTENIKSVKDIPKMKDISQEIMRQWNEEQNAYDDETEHSLDEEKQKEWVLNVQQRLDALKAYASK